jgi:hypothetical protein
MNQKTLLTPIEAACYLKCSIKTLANWRSKGIGPPFIKKGRIAYEQTELERWLDGRTFTSTAQARLRGHKSQPP